MNPLPTKKDVVSLRTIKKDDVPQCKLMFAIEPYKDHGATMDIGLINVHLPQGIKKDNVCG